MTIKWTVGRSIGDLQQCAAAHLRHYLDPAAGRAYWTYDVASDPATLTALDCLAPNLLSVSVKDPVVIPMFKPSGPLRELHDAMQAVLDLPDEPDFLELDLTDATGPWAVVRNAMRKSENRDGVATGITAVGVSKILHRKRPSLVPVYDSKVFAFYFGRGPSGRRAPRHFWPTLQLDLQDNQTWVAALRNELLPAGGPPLSTLRAADIVIWEHMVRPTDACAT